MTTRSEQKQKTRQKLVETALLLFSENGILGTRTLDIAKAAQVSHGALFVHFPTRDALVAAVIDVFSQKVIQRIHELVAGGAGLRAVLSGHLTGLIEHEEFYSRLVDEGPLLPPYARSTLIGIQSAISLHFASAAKREVQRGHMRQVPVPMLFNTWLGLLHYYINNRELFAPNASVLQRHGQKLLDHYMRLLTK